MNWSSSVITGLSSDTEPAIIVSFDSGRYVFNVGENLTRASLQSRRGWKKVKGMFLTQASTKRMGGMTGSMMSIADASARHLDIVGPPGIRHILASMRLFFYRQTLRLNIHEVPPLLPSGATATPPDPTPVFKDENISVYSIPLSSDASNSVLNPISTTSEDIDMSDAIATSPLKRKRSRSPSPTIVTPSQKVFPGHLATSSSKYTTPETPIDDDPEEPQPSLLERYRADPQNFPISALTGPEAEEWRKLVVDSMFALSPEELKPKQAPIVREEQKPRGRGRQPPKEIPPPPPPPTRRDRGPARLNPARSTHQLPRFVHPLLASPPSSTTTSEPTPISVPDAYAYLVLGPRVRGRFNAQRADELGLKGALRGRVTRGETVTFTVEVEVDDGNGGKRKEKVERSVGPEDCLAESEAPTAVIILDVPTPSHITSLLNSFDRSQHPFFAKFRSQNPLDHKELNTHMVYHILGDGVLEDARYKEFMRGFAEGTNHMISSRAHCPDPMTFTSVALNQLRLNQLDADIFPALKYNVEPKVPLSSVPDLPPNVHTMTSNTLTEHRPARPPTLDIYGQIPNQFRAFVQSSSAVSEGLTLTQPTLNAYDQARDRIKIVAAQRAKRAESGEQRGRSRDRKGQDENETGKEEAGGRGRPGDDVVVIPLGTSSAVASRFRNVSSLLIQLPNNAGYALFDAGEGTWGQMARYFGLDKDSTTTDEEKKGMQEESETAYDVLRKLKLVFISHIHADHHPGLPRILALRAKLDPPPPDPLYIIAPESIHLYLRELSDTENLGLAPSYPSSSTTTSVSSNGVVQILAEHIDVVAKACNPYSNWYGRAQGGEERNKIFMGNWKKISGYERQVGYSLEGGGGVLVSKVGGEAPVWKDAANSQWAADALCDTLGLQSIETVNVRHRVRAFGIVVTHRDGWRVVYSGDTLPTKNLVLAGEDATLLIHEATLGDDEAEMAYMKGHTTVGQAVFIGQEMHAENVLLTHFSTRYPRMPEYIYKSPAPSRPPSPSHPLSTSTSTSDPALSTLPNPPAKSRDRSRSSLTPLSTNKHREHDPVVAISLDHARLRVGDMWKMQLYLRAIEKSFWDVREEGDEEEEEAVMRASMGEHNH